MNNAEFLLENIFKEMYKTAKSSGKIYKGYTTSGKTNLLNAIFENVPEKEIDVEEMVKEGKSFKQINDKYKTDKRKTAILDDENIIIDEDIMLIDSLPTLKRKVKNA